MEENSTQPGSPEVEQEQTLTISPEKVCFIIIKAKEYDAKDEATEPEHMMDAVTGAGKGQAKQPSTSRGRSGMNDSAWRERLTRGWKNPSQRPMGWRRRNLLARRLSGMSRLGALFRVSRLLAGQIPTRKLSLVGLFGVPTGLGRSEKSMQIFDGTCRYLAKVG
jgi:hypothetical protein